MVRLVIIRISLNKQTGVYRGNSLMRDAASWHGRATVDVTDGTLSAVKASECVRFSRKIIAASTGKWG